MKTNTETATAPAVGSGDLLDTRTIPLKRWALCCYGQIAMALTMGALGMIDRHTVIPACYFAAINLVVAVVASEKKSYDKDVPRSHERGEPQ